MQSPDRHPGLGASLRPALILITVLALARFIYLAWLCPYSLVEDEAFYWEWAQHPAWSYNTKGPGIAWAIWLSTSVFGDSAFGVRTVAVVSSIIGALGVAGLASELACRTDGSVRPSGGLAPLLAAAGYNLLPAFQAAGLLATIDGPYLAFWSVACWLAVRAMVRGSGPAWFGLGLALGAGFLFKYTILLLALGLIIAGWRGRRVIRWPARRWLVLGALGFGAGLLPVLVWNAQNDWVTVKHLLGHLGIKPGTVGQMPPGAPGSPALSAPPPPDAKHGAYNPKWTAELVLTQLAIIGPALLAMFAGLLGALRGGLASYGGVASGLGQRVLLAASWPILLFYLLLTFNSQAEGNWPIAGFVGLLPIGALWLTQWRRTWLGPVGHGMTRSGGVAEPSAGLPARGFQRFVLNATLIYGLVAGLGMARLDVLRSAADAISPALGKAIPVGRLTGTAELASHIQRLLAEAKADTTLEPFVLSQSYGRASQLVFELPGHPVVFVAQSRLGGRAVQQDYWPSHSVDRPDLLGRPAVIVADFDDPKLWEPWFERVVPVGQLDGAIRAGRFGFVGYGYKGLPKRPPAGF